MRPCALARAPPKTQAALLESMEGRQVTVDGTKCPLPAPFTAFSETAPVGTAGFSPAVWPDLAMRDSSGFIHGLLDQTTDHEEQFPAGRLSRIDFSQFWKASSAEAQTSVHIQWNSSRGNPINSLGSEPVSSVPMT